jgi:hypothetical protein
MLYAKVRIAGRGSRQTATTPSTAIDTNSISQMVEAEKSAIMRDVQLTWYACAKLILRGLPTRSNGCRLAVKGPLRGLGLLRPGALASREFLPSKKKSKSARIWRTRSATASLPSAPFAAHRPHPRSPRLACECPCHSEKYSAFAACQTIGNNGELCSFARNALWKSSGPFHLPNSSLHHVPVPSRQRWG